MIRFACPGCQATFTVEDAKAGKTGNCPKCQTQFIIPQAEEAPQPSSAVSSSAPVEIEPCPKCQTRLSVAASDVGSDVECPYCKTVFKAAKAGSRPPAPPPAPPRKSDLESTDDMGRPKSRRRPEDEDDDRPRKRGRRDEDDESERPSRRRRDDDDDDDDRPSRRRGSARRGAMTGMVVVSRIGVLSTGKIQGAIGVTLGTIVAIPLMVISLIGAGAGAAGNAPPGAAGAVLGMGICFTLLLPVFYGVAGFIGGIIGAAIYNLVAGFVGGMEMELEEG